MRAGKIPWEPLYAELKRVVTACNRYPKTTEQYIVGEARANLHTLYRHYASLYDSYVKNATSPSLEPFQVRALEALPGWVPYGVEGPYPWKQCIAFLEKWLEGSAGVPPMLNINNGGYVGLDATPLERLSGLCTCINQGDGKARKGKAPGSGFTIAREKQADLDRVCAKYGLQWRKKRDETGELAGTSRSFIQESYEQFKNYYKKHGPTGEFIQRWYPGFPDKHRKCEQPEVIKAKVAPPRRKPKNVRPKFRTRSSTGSSSNNTLGSVPKSPRRNTGHRATKPQSATLQAPPQPQPPPLAEQDLQYLLDIIDEGQ
jgi:hypothetical protein